MSSVIAEVSMSRCCLCSVDVGKTKGKKADAGLFFGLIWKGDAGTNCISYKCVILI